MTDTISHLHNFIWLLSFLLVLRTAKVGVLFYICSLMTSVLTKEGSQKFPFTVIIYKNPLTSYQIRTRWCWYGLYSVFLLWMRRLYLCIVDESRENWKRCISCTTPINKLLPSTFEVLNCNTRACNEYPNFRFNENDENDYCDYSSQKLMKLSRFYN